MTVSQGNHPPLHVGALEGRRWAGLVFAGPGGGAGLGIRLRFQAPEGLTWDWEDWYWAVSRVGPHAPDGSYAEVAFDLSAAPGPENEPRSEDLQLEWSGGDGHLVLRARVHVAGTLDVVGDTPWDWPDRWSPDHGHGWRGQIGDVPVALAFGEGADPLPTDQEAGPSRRLTSSGRAGEPQTLTLVAAWGAESTSQARGILAEASDHLATARSDWLDHRPAATGEWPDLVNRISDQVHWMVLLQPETGAHYAPAGRRWIFPRCNPPGSDGDRTGRLDDWTAFGWDSFFNALELSVTSPDLAWAALLAGLRTQYENGNVPNWRGRYGGTPDRSQPPVGSFAALKLHLSHPSESRLEQALPYLVRWSEWWDGSHGGQPRRRGLSDGLYAWGSDTSLIPANVPTWEAGASGHQRAAWESGQDDLPLWDDVSWDDRSSTLAMSAVDLCAYRAMDLECLSRLAELTGDSATAARAREAYLRLSDRMNQVLWSSEAGLYLDELPGAHSHRVAASNFLPLVAGVPDPEQARRMVTALEDPARFWGAWLLPSISRDDPSFPDQQYWRGSIWPPMNYLILQGLRRYGYYEAARVLALRGARMFLEDARATGMCRENFDARTGRGQGRRFQSWGPLFALGAVEELVRTCPWQGTTVGWATSPEAAHEPGSATGVARMAVAGHTWWVEPEPGGFRFRLDGYDWIRVESSGPLTEVRVEDHMLVASASRPALIRTEGRSVFAEHDGQVRVLLHPPHN